MDENLNSKPSVAGAERRFPRAVLHAWLICGCLDITAAFVDAGWNQGASPIRVLQGVAGALLGPATFEFGLASATLGLAMHFGVALTVTAIFHTLSRRWPLLVRHAIPSGLVYGALVYLVMFRAVLPLTIELKSLYLSNFSHAWPKLRWPQFGIHLFCVGLAISLSIRRWGRPAA